jgi:hypothetical protein
MVMQRKSLLNSSIALMTAVAQLLMREFNPPPGLASSGNPGARVLVTDAHVALFRRT